LPFCMPAHKKAQTKSVSAAVIDYTAWMTGCEAGRQAGRQADSKAGRQQQLAILDN
jgi:hypothetical protein